MKNKRSHWRLLQLFQVMRIWYRYVTQCFLTEPDLVLALMYDQNGFGLLKTDDAIDSRYSLWLRSIRALVSRRSLRYFPQAGFWEVRALPLRSREKALFRAASFLCRKWITLLSIHGRLLMSLIFIFVTCCSTHVLSLYIFLFLASLWA